MSPKILQRKDFEKVKQALIKFYTERPPVYGNWDGRDKIYQEYAIFLNSKIQAKGKHLDFGTGTWKIANEISVYDFEEVVGLDYFSDEDLERLNNELSSNKKARVVKYQEPDVIPFEDNYFDSISSLCVIEHVVEIEKIFEEMNRVLKPGGTLVIECPNWSGPNPAITAIKKNLGGKRFWLYNNLLDSVFGVARAKLWYLKNLIGPGEFIRIYPRMKDGEIDFEFSDDDVVHLCQPLSIKKYFSKKGYRTIMYNRGSGKTLYSKIFNLLFPSLATTNQLVFQKGN